MIKKIITNKKLLLAFIAADLIGLCISYVYLYAAPLGLCQKGSAYCYQLYEGIGRPLRYGTLSVLPLMVIQLFLPDIFFTIWKYFFIFILIITIHAAETTSIYYRDMLGIGYYENLQIFWTLFIIASAVMFVFLGIYSLMLHWRRQNAH